MEVEQARGRRAGSPLHMSRAAWVDVARRVLDGLRADNVPVVAAGAAFYAFIALVPGLVFVSLVAGLVSSPSTVATRIGDYVPGAGIGDGGLVARALVEASGIGGDGVGLGALAAFAGLLWVASSGADGLIRGINIAYGEEQRAFPRRRGLALLMSLGAIVFGVVAFALVVAFPPVVERMGLAPAARVGVAVARWVGLAVIVLVGLGLLYRYAPNRDRPPVRWLSVGAVVAAAVWLLGSLGFVAYVEWLGGFGARYGSLGGVVVLCLWLFVTSFAVLLGAEINAALEEQDAQDV